MAAQNRFRGRRMLRKIAALLKEPQLNAALRRSKSLNLSPTKLAPDPLGTPTWQSRTWRLINDPSSSVPAFLIGVLVLLFILLSCTSFVVESLPTLNGRCAGLALPAPTDVRLSSHAVHNRERRWGGEPCD